MWFVVFLCFFTHPRESAVLQKCAFLPHIGRSHFFCTARFKAQKNHTFLECAFFVPSYSPQRKCGFYEMRLFSRKFQDPAFSEGIAIGSFFGALAVPRVSLSGSVGVEAVEPVWFLELRVASVSFLMATFTNGVLKAISFAQLRSTALPMPMRQKSVRAPFSQCV